MTFLAMWAAIAYVPHVVVMLGALAGSGVILARGGSRGAAVALLLYGFNALFGLVLGLAGTVLPQVAIDRGMSISQLSGIFMLQSAFGMVTGAIATVLLMLAIFLPRSSEDAASAAGA
jgi:hypothetical protein